MEQFRPKMQWMMCTMLRFVRSVSLDIWRVERSVCFWPLWFSKLTISSTVAMFFSVCVCFSLPVSCLWSVLHVSQISVNNNPTLSLLQSIFKNSPRFFQRLYFLNQHKYLIRTLSPLQNHRYIIVNALKIIIYNNIICFCLQTSEMHEKLNKI